MRMLLFVALALAGTAPLSFSQGVPETPEGIVREALSEKSSAVYTGVWDKLLSRLADSAAVEVTKVVGGKVLSAGDVDRILLVLRMSFSAPKIIEKPADRNPRTALFVLRYLATLPVPDEVRAKIVRTKELVVQRTKSGTRNDQSGGARLEHRPPQGESPP